MCRKASLGSIPVALLTITVLFSLTSALLMPVYASQTLYGCTSGLGGGLSSLYTIDPATGTATLVGSMNIIKGCSAIAFGPSGVLYATGATNAGTESLFTVNTATGAATLVGSVARGSTCGTHAQPNEISDMKFSSTGTLYIMFAQPPHCLATVNPSTAAETDIGQTGVSGSGNALAISSSNVFYHTSDSSPPILYTLNPSTGTATMVTSMSVSGGFPSACTTNNAFSRVADLAFDGTGVLYGLLNCAPAPPFGPVYLVTVNTSTGVMTIIGQTLDAMDGFTFSPPVPIPEYPFGVLVLAILMVGAYGLVRRETITKRDQES
jgi:hypothetical protein